MRPASILSLAFLRYHSRQKSLLLLSVQEYTSIPSSGMQLSKTDISMTLFWATVTSHLLKSSKESSESSSRLANVDRCVSADVICASITCGLATTIGAMTRQQEGMSAFLVKTKRALIGI